MREIVLDTETTGLDADKGDRLVEIGCVELWNRLPTGRSFQTYLDPERAMSVDAAAITGITDERLRGQPTFGAVVERFAAFISNDPLVIHNAAFDVGFLNMELRRVGWPRLEPSRVIDTVAIARKRFPGASASLDALCRRFGIDNSAREKHGALLDAELLAEVYLELMGGRQPSLTLGAATTERRADATSALTPSASAGSRRRQRATPEELAAHAAFVSKLGASAVWTRYATPSDDAPKTSGDAPPVS